MRRRAFVGTVGGAAGAAVGGCLTLGDGEDGQEEPADGDPDDPALDDTVRVATVDSMVGEGDTPGAWVADAFEEAYPSATLQWTVPEGGVDHYLERVAHDAEIDADVYLGLTVEDLRRVDDAVGAGALFRTLDRDRIDGIDRIRSGLDVEDPHGRVLPYDTDYVCLRYDETAVDRPGSLEDLRAGAFEDALETDDPRTSAAGRAFLLWTIAARGEDGYLDYWRDLADNGVRILDGRSGIDESRPVIVSYAADRRRAIEVGAGLRRSAVAFPDGQGYATPGLVAILEGTRAADLAYEFVDFVCSPEVQAEIAERTTRAPAVEGVDGRSGDDVHVPPEAVALRYDRVRDDVDRWVGDWERAIGS